MTASRTKGSSGAIWESKYGYSRVVRHGSLAWVAGTTAASEGEPPPIGAADQARRAFAIAINALESVGLRRSDVVRTRMFVTASVDADAIGLVHAEFFGDVAPVASMVVVAGLIDPALLVEVELDASAEFSNEAAVEI